MKIVKATDLSSQERDLVIDESADFTNPYILYVMEPEIGYLSGRLLFKELEIYQVYVREQYRRQGWGRCLVERALTGLDLDRAILEVRKGNEAARALYQGTGFYQIAIRQDYYHNPKEDAVIMEWRCKDDKVTHTSH